MRKLQERGFVVVARNFRTKFGEVDIVAVDGKELVFVEVKMRTSEGFGLPEEAVDVRKMEKVKRMAEYFFVVLHSELP